MTNHTSSSNPSDEKKNKEPNHTITPNDNNTITLTFEDISEEITIGYNKVNDFVNDLEEAKRKATVASLNRIKLGKKERDRSGKLPYHLLHEYGCQYSDKMDANIRNVDLYSFANSNKTDYIAINRQDEKIWVDTDENTSRPKITTIIDRNICDKCASTLHHWHTQRKYFLPLLADEVTEEEIAKENVTTLNEKTPTVCNTCGTPNSAIYKIETDIPNTDINSPVQICSTCHGLLFNNNERDFLHGITPLDITNHPRANKNGELTPITDPNEPSEPESTSAEETQSEESTKKPPSERNHRIDKY